MGGKFSSHKNKSFHWSKPHKKRSALFTKFLTVLLYTRNHDLIPNSILLEDIPFPTNNENWSVNEYNIWFSLLKLLEIRSKERTINKIEINGKNYVEMSFINNFYDDEGFNNLIEHLRNDDYYWKKSQNILEGIIQENIVVPKRSLSPTSFCSDYTLDGITYDDGDVIDDIKIEQLLIKFQLYKDKYGLISKEKKKNYNNVANNIWIWKKPNRHSRVNEISILKI
ncbi:hypothetical protein C1645_763157 [Glomus cerebriforme]|uniref:Uncharacterized protein n=1 Tax=Glomus cerebriforme TaxID=658196 RepID=A0A397T453_9GLOM|nr:hypothetical protein C1645_763157 [Glomus cerebriforme]